MAGFNSENIEDLKNDKWLQHAKKISQSEHVNSRAEFMLTCAFYYTMLNIEKVPEDKVQDYIQDGFKVEEISKKWQLDEFADFIDKVSIIATSRMLGQVINIINRSDAPDEHKKQIIDEIMHQNVIESWHIS